MMARGCDSAKATVQQRNMVWRRDEANLQRRWGWCDDDEAMLYR